MEYVEYKMGCVEYWRELDVDLHPTYTALQEDEDST